MSRIIIYKTISCWWLKKKKDNRERKLFLAALSCPFPCTYLSHTAVRCPIYQQFILRLPFNFHQPHIVPAVISRYQSICLTGTCGKTEWLTLFSKSDCSAWLLCFPWFISRVRHHFSAHDKLSVNYSSRNTLRNGRIIHLVHHCPRLVFIFAGNKTKCVFEVGKTPLLFSAHVYIVVADVTLFFM